MINRFTAKTKKPLLNSVVERRRLFDDLDRLYASGRFIWIHAPPGFGKTTLAAGYADYSNRHVTWYRLDESDADPAYFFESLQSTLTTRGEDINNPWVFKLEYLSGLSAFSRQFFRRLIPDDGIDKLIVLDDFHEIQSAPYAISIVRALLEESPDHCRFLFLSRLEPPNSISVAQYASLSLLSPDFLLFNEADAEQLARLLAYDVDAAEWQDVLSRCNGWAAALTIRMRQQTHRHLNTQRSLDSLAQSALSDFSHDILEQLRHLALPNAITKAMAIDLTEGDEAASILSRLAAEGYFISRIESDPESYVIHPILRGFLHEQLRTNFSEAEYAAYLLRTAGILEKYGEIGQALDICCRASRWQDVERLILTYAKQELAEGRSIRLLSWLNSIPKSSDSNPWLDFWHATAMLSLNPKHAQQLFEQAHRRFGGDPLGRVISAAGAISAHYFSFDDFGGATRWFDELAQLDGFVEDLHNPEVEFTVLGCGNMLLHFDIYPDLYRKWLRRTQDIISDCPPDRLLFLATFLLQDCIWSGEFDACYALIAQLQQQSGRPDPFYEINLLNWRTIADFMTDNHLSAYRATERAIDLADNFGLAFLKCQIYGHEVYTAQSCLDLDRAATALAKMEHYISPERRLNVSYFLHLRSGMALLQNDLQAAKHDAEMSLTLCRQLRIRSTAAICHQVLAQISIALGDWDTAAAHLAETEAYCLRTNKRFIYFTSQLTRAHGLLTVNQDDAAEMVLKDALAIGRQKNYLNAHPFWLPKAMSHLCRFALEREIEPNYVRYLIERRRLNPPGDASESWPWPLKIRTLGQFRVDSSSVSAGKTAMRDGKPLRLLQWLIALNPDGTSKQTLADLLWPDADADAALHALEVNLQRLRRLLGVADAIILQSNSVQLNRNRCWLDIWTLDDVVRRIENPPINAAAQAERLLKIWRGPFTTHLEHPLFLKKRESLTAKFARTIEKLGLILEKSGFREQAIDCYVRAVEAEPLAETLHYRLIVCLKNENRLADAVLAYRRCRIAFTAESGLTLSQTLIDLGESL